MHHFSHHFPTIAGGVGGLGLAAAEALVPPIGGREILCLFPRENNGDDVKEEWQKRRIYDDLG